MGNDKVIIDVVSDIANLTGIKMDIIDLVLTAYDLVILDKILEGQLSNDDTDYIEVGSLVIDNTAYPAITVRAGDLLLTKIHDTVHHARDFLSESIITKFNSDLLSKYTNESAEDHSSAIMPGDPYE